MLQWIIFYQHVYVSWNEEQAQFKEVLLYFTGSPDGGSI